MRLIPPIKTFILKQVAVFLLVLFCFLSFVKMFRQTATIEMYAGAGNPTGNGLTTWPTNHPAAQHR